RHTAEGTPLPLTEPLDSPAYRAVQLLAAAAALAWCLWLKRRRAPRAWLVHAALAVGCAWLLLFGPAAEHATFAFLAAPLAWPRGRWLIGAAGALILVLGWGGLVRPWADDVPLLLAALPVGTGLFTAWLIGWAATQPWRDKTAERGAPLGWRLDSQGDNSWA